MGQANKRGPKEARVAQAIAREAEELRQRRLGREAQELKRQELGRERQSMTVMRGNEVIYSSGQGPKDEQRHKDEPEI